MEGMAWGYTGQRMVGIGRLFRWEPGSTGLVVPDVLLVQSFKSITCFGRAFHVKGALACLADEVFLWV